MTITVELHQRDFATVYFTPSLLERLLLRRSSERAAYRVFSLRDGGWVWRYLDHRRVSAAIQRELDSAYRGALIARATAPPR